MKRDEVNSHSDVRRNNMTMEIYHFVKYYEGLSLDSLIDKNKSNATLCFDLEDSIQDIFNSKRNPDLKAYHRKLLENILSSCTIDTGSLKIGVRINSSTNKEQALDLSLLNNLQTIHTILLPKTESSEQIIDLIYELEKNNINYKEIIPIVETKLGMTNLESIAKVESTKIKRVAFGHCDYNLDINHFPFFHQNSREYWSWIEKIVSIIEPYGLKFVNSPFLELDNDLDFKKMLSSLFSICGYDCGQIAMTFNQAMACHKNNRQATPYFTKLPNRLNMKAEQSFAKKFVESFENGNNNRAFTITGEERIFLSPQEYLASQNFASKILNFDYNFTFVGGCFPVQGNLLFEDLFHQLLKTKFEKQYNVNFNVNIIRYERFKNCLDKIKTFADNNPIDILVFCIRPEPILRLTKLSYKFIDNLGRVRRTFNLPYSKHLNPEKYDLLAIESTVLPTNRQEISKNKTWTNLNYFFGLLIGNNRVALNKYLKLIDELLLFCNANNIPIMIMGPAIRTNTSMEKIISKGLEKFMKKNIVVSEDKFINGSDLIKDGNKLFQNNGIHANKYYHKLIADRIENKLSKTIEKIATPNSTFAIMAGEVRI